MNNNNDSPKESSSSSSPDKPSSAEKQQLSHETTPVKESESVTLTVAQPKKRRGARTEEAGSSSTVKRKGELLDPPAREPKCVVCGKHFHSWKALFGHMRSHPDRQWRGVYPPPTGTWDPFGLLQEREEIASTLLNVAEGVLQSMNATGTVAKGKERDDEASASLPRREEELGFDLNEPQEKGPSGSKSPIFDLNMPPPEKDDEDSSASSS